MSNLFASYRQVGKPVLSLITAQFFLNLINIAFMQILLVYMEKNGYADDLSARLISYRFLGVLLLALPIGLAIRGRRIKPLFYIATVGSPLFSLLLLYAIDHHQHVLIYIANISWGICFTCMQVGMIPFLLRNAPASARVEAFALSFATWSLGGICSGILIYGFSFLRPQLYSEGRVLTLITVFALMGVYFVWRAKILEVIPDAPNTKGSLISTDLRLLAKAMLPTLLMAIGAGLTIPFVGLFFFKIHGMDANHFALLSAVTTAVVFVSSLYAPSMNRTLDDQVAILLTQMTAILLLVVLALTQQFGGSGLAVLTAGVCFVLRQPLMNIAQPLTTEFIMRYVGPTNQELVSGLQAAIWSGSWFISSQLFSLLRRTGLDYMVIFLLTAMIYTTSVACFYLLMRDYRKRSPKVLVPRLP